jgi:hypothetical protein
MVGLGRGDAERPQPEASLDDRGLPRLGIG